MAQAQGVPGEPMPMNMAPAGGMPGGPMPMFGTGYGPGMPPMGPGGGMPGMMPPMMPGMGDPGSMGMPGMPSGPMMPGGPMMNVGENGPNGMPGVGLPMGATYYPGISGVNRTTFWDKILFNEDGERRRFYGKAGYIGLRRNSLDANPLISVEPFFNNIDGDGDSTFGLTPFIASTDIVSGGLNNGVQAAIGLQDDCAGIIFEVGGFYIVNTATSYQNTLLGRLDSPFTNAPEGFQDNAGLWTNADFMRLYYKNSIYSGEANLRFFGSCWKSLDISYMIGFRYIKLQDSLQHYTIDDDLQQAINDPATRATLNWRASNDMMGLQIGWSMTQRLTQAWSVSWDQKIAFLCNTATTTSSLIRDDGLVGYDASRSSKRFAQAYESGLYLDLSSGNARLRAGYDLKFYVGVATADGLFNYDLELAPTTRNTTDTVVYHGPSISIEFVY